MCVPRFLLFLPEFFWWYFEAHCFVFLGVVNCLSFQKLWFWYYRFCRATSYSPNIGVELPSIEMDWSECGWRWRPWWWPDSDLHLTVWYLPYNCSFFFYLTAWWSLCLTPSSLYLRSSCDSLWLLAFCLLPRLLFFLCGWCCCCCALSIVCFLALGFVSSFAWTTPFQPA